MFSMHGTPIGGGIVIGRAHVLESHRLDAVRCRIDRTQLDAEVTRLQAALVTVREELAQVGSHLPEDAPPEARALLDVHAMILDDPMLIEQSTASIREQGWNAEWAFATQAGELSAQFEAFEDEYLRERGRDVVQVAGRVLRALSGSCRASQADAEQTIVVATDISPADMLSLKRALGFAIDLGGTTSHTAILARSLNVPAVVGLNSASELVREDDWLILDGDSGVLIVAPDETVLAEYRHRQAASLLEQQKLRRLIHVPARTLDGVSIGLMANIELPEEAEQAYEAGAAGVGLFRSEFLFLNRRDLPDEEEQFEAYASAIRAMRGKPVTIRTLDVGADKTLADADESAVAPNPALGLRAIRYCLAQPQMFLAQLRAMLRASALGPLRILIPMLAHDHEIDQALQLIAQARAQLAQRGQACGRCRARGRDDRGPGRRPVGGPVRTQAGFPLHRYQRPDPVHAGDRSCRPRGGGAVRPVPSCGPATDRLTIRAGRRAGKPVAVCGEMAGHWTATRAASGHGPGRILDASGESAARQARGAAGRHRAAQAARHPPALQRRSGPGRGGSGAIARGRLIHRGALPAPVSDAPGRRRPNLEPEQFRRTVVEPGRPLGPAHHVDAEGRADPDTGAGLEDHEPVGIDRLALHLDAAAVDPELGERADLEHGQRGARAHRQHHHPVVGAGVRVVGHRPPHRPRDSRRYRLELERVEDDVGRDVRCRIDERAMTPRSRCRRSCNWPESGGWSTGPSRRDISSVRR
jgi:phosphotransferase system enzyme I (PtsI)